jgi:hypothetical protein
MSPTSYQAALPRDLVANFRALWRSVKDWWVLARFVATVHAARFIAMSS